MEGHFYSIPMGIYFEHRGKEYIKTGNEEAKDSNGKRHLFEVHYGCLVEKSVSGIIRS